jgi:C1A family cysteine protease
MSLPITVGGHRFGFIRKPKYEGYGRRFALLPEHLENLPPVLDLSAGFGPVLDQGQLGSCTANAIAGAIQYDQIRQGIANFTPSRLFIYYGERAIEGTVGEDAGADIGDGIQVVSTLGAPPESDWGYADDPTTFTEMPPPTAYADGLKNLVTQSAAVPQDETQLKAVMNLGFPIAFGITAFPELESDEVMQSGILPMPADGEQPIGGHAIILKGWDDSLGVFGWRNSWGSKFGLNGFGTIPKSYVLNPALASRFFVIRAVA